MTTRRLRAKLRETTENAILDAAERVAAREGVAGANLQVIAEQAGIAVGTIYNYFDDKLELFRALFTRRREEFLEALDDAAERHAREPFAQQLEAFVRAVFEHFDQRRAFLRIALHHELPPAAAGKTKAARLSSLQQLQERAERVVRLGLREKRLRNDGSEGLLATVLVAIVRGVLTMRADGPQPFALETARVVSLFLEGAGK